jgi:tetrahydromethanopterin S-methyltransferase subunit A
MLHAVRRRLEDLAGALCEIMIPIKHDYCMGQGNNNNVAICTLASLSLLEMIAKSPDLMSRILVVGRLLSENRGIDLLIRSTLTYPHLHHLVICGDEVKGHRSGQALLSLHANGVNEEDGRIIGAIGPNPFLCSSLAEIELFRKQVRIYDLIGTRDLKVIRAQLSLISHRRFD